MPYRDKDKDRAWHKEYMRRKRQGVTKGVTNSIPVTPEPSELVTPIKSDRQSLTKECQVSKRGFNKA